MTAQNLRCPGCGAPASQELPACTHCGARLATIGCAACFGMMFLGSRHCPHCGVPAAEAEPLEMETLPCPRCAAPLHATRVGGTPLRDCPRCGGIWLDAEVFQAVTADRESQAAVLTFTLQRPDGESAAEGAVRYIACPRCSGIMNRVNFARISGVIVDSCRGHGTWFDRDELRRMVEFIRAGGMEASRERDRLKHEEELRRAREGQPAQVAAEAPQGDGPEVILANVVRFLVTGWR